MELNACGRGQDGGFRVGIQLVKRAHALFDFGFGQAGHAQVAGEKAFRITHAGKARAHFGFEHRLQFSGRPWQQNQYVVFGFDPQTGRGAARIGKDDRTFRDHRLANIYFRHGACKTAKAFLNAAQNFLIAMQFAAQQVRDGFSRAVIIGGTESATTDDKFRTIEGVAK